MIRALLAFILLWLVVAVAFVPAELFGAVAFALVITLVAAAVASAQSVRDQPGDPPRMVALSTRSLRRRPSQLLDARSSASTAIPPSASAGSASGVHFSPGETR